MSAYHAWARMKIPPCPKCHSKKVTLIGKRNALYPAGCLVVFQLLFAMLHRLQSPIEFRCDKCHERFSRRFFSERFALLGFVAVIFGWVGLMVYVFWLAIQSI